MHQPSVFEALLRFVLVAIIIGGGFFVMIYGPAAGLQRYTAWIGRTLGRIAKWLLRKLGDTIRGLCHWLASLI